MKILIALIPALPLFGFLVTAIFGRWLPRKVVSLTAVGSVTASAVITIITGIIFLSPSFPADYVTSTIYTWLRTSDLSATISFYLDPLSLVFCFVITFVGALIHLYSVEFMAEDDGFSRFFSYMNLFVGSMLLLVLADNLLLLYLGWEGVGLCSYLLIGFWYRVPEFGYSARKAFIVTRIGDTAMILGLILLFVSFGTLNIRNLMHLASVDWESGSFLPVVASILLLAGALGKSAQLPLQTWLPDAMAGPSPVSALIHAATMVTAGVYLITRTHVLFTLAPVVMAAVAITGALTLLISGFSALAQVDLKRVLAYSTISQIGYMFLAMGIGAWSAAVFHFMIHAFFKALLFLSGGAVIHLLNDEHNIFKMGGLRKSMPVVFITFLCGAASLSALPLITAGFYSKDQILWFGWSSSLSSHLLWIAGITGALLTSLYTFRLVFIAFYGEMKIRPLHRPGKLIAVPIIILAVLSLIGGFIEMPENMGPVHLFTTLFTKTLPAVKINGPGNSELLFQIISAVISTGGVYIAYLLFYKGSHIVSFFRAGKINKFFLEGWGFDKLYNFMFVRPVVWLSEIDRKDFVDLIYKTTALGTEYFNQLLSKTQNGKLRWYVLFLTAGVVIIITLMITL